MTHQTVQHGTATMERRLSASPTRVFAAWVDPEQRKAWSSPSDEIDMRIDAADFSVGGEDVTTCLAGGEAVAIVRGRYHDIVPDKRIVYTEIIASMEATEGACLVSAEFLPEGEGTRLVITLQTVALDGSALLEEAQAGWGSALIRLEDLLQAG